MLIGKAPSVNFTPRPNRLESLRHSHGSLFYFSQSCSSKCTKKSSRSVVMVKAGYTSTPKDVMSWNPSATTCRLTENLKNSNDTATPATDKKTHGGIETVPILTSNDSPTPSSGRVSGSFGRLKAQKVKALVQRTSRIKKERNGDDDEIVLERAPFEKSVKSNYRKESVGSKQIVKSESSKLPQERRNLYADSDFFSRKSFKDLGYSEYMIESLKKQSFVRPSNIQAMAFSPVIDQKSCIIADQSGSGKTLAYLAPLVQRLRQEELEGCSKSLSQAPRVVILAPTAELASQVLSNCRSISKFGVPFKSMVVTGGFRQRTQLENLQQGVDVLIATPGRFMFLIKEGFLQLTNLRCAVLDEVDIHFNDEDFEAALQCLINSSPVTTQYLFVTATLPGVIYNKLIEVFPDCEVIMGPGMHRINAGLEEVLVDCSGEDGIEKTPETAFLNKKTALLQLLEGSTVPKTIVFCNKIETCRKVENILKRSDRKEIRMKILPFHAAVTQESRLANMKEFRHTTSREVSQFLVCTDRASRGIDFVRVDHVILFDFPRDPSEYVRRVGRTARGAGGKGKAFIFVVGKQVSLARRIIERNQKGHPLHDVPCTY